MPSSIPPVNHPSAPPRTWHIHLELLDRNPHQPRTEMDEAALAELMASIREHGLLQPITVRKAGARYQVIAGHRRLEAFRRLLAAAGQSQAAIEHFRTIPAHEEFDVTDEEMALFALIENLQRQELSPLEAALGLARFQEARQLSTEAPSKRTGLERDHVKRLLRLASRAQGGSGQWRSSAVCFFFSLSARRPIFISGGARSRRAVREWLSPNAVHARPKEESWEIRSFT